MMRKAWKPMRAALQNRLHSLASWAFEAWGMSSSPAWVIPTVVANRWGPQIQGDPQWDWRLGLQSRIAFTDPEIYDARFIQDKYNFNFVMRFGKFQQSSSHETLEPALQWRCWSELPAEARGNIASMIGFDPKKGPSSRKHPDWNGGLSQIVQI